MGFRGKRMISNRTMKVAALVALGLVLSACSSNSSSSASPSGTASTGGDILIGVNVPLSGDYAAAGVDIVNGAQLSAKAINGAQAAQKLISQKVVAVAGGYCSGASLPALAQFHTAGIPFVMVGSTNPQLTEQGFAEAFRTIFRDDVQGPFVAKFIATYLKAKKVAVVDDSTTYAKGLADQTVIALKAAGVDVVYNNALTPGQSDYSSVLTKVAQTKPDVFYYSGYFAEFGLLIKQAKAQGLKFQMMGGDANNDATVIKTAGTAAEGVLIDTAPLAQFLTSAQGYVTAYKAAYGSTPGPYSAYEYDAVGVIAAAIKKAGSTDSAKITASLHNLGDYAGITGTFHFDSKGDRKPANYIVITVKNGVFAPFKSFDAATGQWVSGS
jgi:branched-chain amino acid transport system substrate-binding protein